MENMVCSPICNYNHKYNFEITIYILVKIKIENINTYQPNKYLNKKNVKSN